MCGGRDSFKQDFGGAKTEGKKKLGRPRRRWNYSIKWNLREIGWGGVEWIGLAQYRDSWCAFVNKKNRSNGSEVALCTRAIDYHITRLGIVRTPVDSERTET